MRRLAGNEDEDEVGDYDVIDPHPRADWRWQHWTIGPGVRRFTIRDFLVRLGILAAFLVSVFLGAWLLYR